MSFQISSSGKASIVKDPEAILDYTLDITDWLDEGDMLLSFEVLTEGVELVSSVVDGSKCVAWLSGGVIGEPASATFRFTTQLGRTDDRTMFFKIRDR